jgi:hypothetical protein
VFLAKIVELITRIVFMILRNPPLLKMKFYFCREILDLVVIEPRRIIVNFILDILKDLNIKEISFLMKFNLLLRQGPKRNLELLLDVLIKRLIFLKLRQPKE